MKFFDQFKGLRITRRGHIVGGVALAVLAAATFLLWVALAADHYHG